MSIEIILAIFEEDSTVLPVAFKANPIIINIQ